MSDEKIAGPNIEVTLDTKGVRASAEEGAKSIDRLAESATKLKANLDPAERGVNGLTAKLKALSPEAATEKLNRLAVAVERAGGSSVKGAAQLEFLQSRIEKLSAAGGVVPASLAGITAETNRMGEALKAVGQAASMSGIGGVGTAARLATAGVGSLAAGVAVAGVATLGAGVAATKLAIDFESAFARVQRTVTPQKANLAELRQGLIDLSTQIPVSAEALASIASMAGQMGISGTQNILKFTETVARLGVTADMSGEEAAKMLARIAQVNNIPIDQIDHLASAVLGVGAKSNATTDEILRMTMQMQQLGSGAGLSAAQMIGLSATLAAGGVRVESAGTAMGRMARDINTAVAGATKDSSTKLQELAHVSGMSAEQFKQAWAKDKTGVLLDLFKGLQDEGDKASHALELLGWQGVRVAGSAGVLAKTHGDLAAMIREANDQMTNNTAIMDQSGKIFGTTESSLTKLKNSFTALGIAMGEGPGKALGSIIDQLTQLINLANKGGLGDFMRSPLRMGAASVTMGLSELGYQSVKSIGRGLDGIDDAFAGYPSKQVAMSPMRPYGIPGMGDPFKSVQVAPSDHIAGVQFGASEPMSKEQQKALEHYKAIQIELEKEYQQALAKTKVGVEAVIDGIHAWADAEREKIENDKQLNGPQKALQEKKIGKTEELKIEKANADEEQRIAKEKESTQKRLASFRLGLAKATDNAEAREGEGIQRTIRQIEAKAEGYRTELALMTDLEPTEREAAEAEIDNYEKVSKASAEAQNALKAHQHGVEGVAKAEMDYKHALQSVHPTLKVSLDLIQDEYNKSVDTLNHKLRIGEIDEAHYRKEIAYLKAIKGLKEDNAKQSATIATLDMIAQGFDRVHRSFSALVDMGAQGERVLDGVGESLKGIDDVAKGIASENPFEVIAGGLEAIGGLMKIFGGETEVERVGREVGKDLGVSISESMAQTIVDTMHKLNVSENIAAALNLDAILADNPRHSADEFLGKMQDLARSIAAGFVPAKVGIEALGKDFTLLKEEAEGGSEASRNAMILLMRQAKELGLAVPEIQEAMKAGIKLAVDNLSAMFAGQGSTQRGGRVFGSVSAAQGAANLTIFDAVFKGAEAFDGLFTAVEENKEAFEELTKGLPAGTKLSGGAADMALAIAALNDPLFAGAAKTGGAAGKVFSGLRNSDALTQGATDAFGVTLKTNMEQAAAGLAGLDATDDQKRRLAEEANLPLLVEMQHARAAGMHLDPATEAFLDQAQADNMLPALSIAEQQLQVLKDIRDRDKTNGANTTGGNGGSGGTGGTGGTGGNAGSANGVPKYGSGGKVNFTPGGRLIRVAENENEWVLRQSDLMTGNLPGVSSSDLRMQTGGASMNVTAPTIINVNIPPGLDPQAVGQALVAAFERDLVPRLKTAAKSAMGL